MEEKRAFKIVIAYETFAAAIHAKEMSERMALQMDSECDAWPFELLAVERVREHAVGMAAAADMIIVAARGAVELPAAVKDWIENGLLQREGDPAALVALLHDDWIVSSKPPSLCVYLQQIAEQANVDFFCNLGRWWRQDAMGIESGYQPPQLSSKTPKEVAPEYSAARGWGIND
jgi:hypothetical protein